MPKNCKNCGAEMPEEAHICLSCLTETEEKAVITADDRPSFPANKKRTAARIAAAVLIILLIIICILYFGSKNNKSVNLPSDTETDKTVVSTTTEKDGSVITEFDDGSVETVEPDATTITQEKNGTVITKSPDGTVEIEKTDATTTTKRPDGTTQTSKNTNENDSSNTAQAKTWSDWSTEKPKEGTYTDIEQRTEYRYRDKSLTTDSSNTMDGWQLYDTTYVWSDYGSWSNWSINHYTSSDSRQTESRTTYRYCAFVCTKCGNRDPYSTPCDNCKTSQYFKWEALWYPTKGTSMNVNTLSTVPDKYYVIINDQRWWFERDGYSDGEGGIGQPSRQEYRYRDRKQIATYHFYKWSEWSEWNTNKVVSSDTREVETRTLYRYIK